MKLLYIRLFMHTGIQMKYVSRLTDARRAVGEEILLIQLRGWLDDKMRQENVKAAKEYDRVYRECMMNQ